MTGELYLKHKDSSTWQDAYTTWGVSLEDSALAALMSPPEAKEDIRNESRLEHGIRHIDNDPKMAERDLTLPMHLVAAGSADYLSKYNSFCTFLKGGWIDLKTIHQPDVIYHLKYRNTQQFRQFIHGIAVFGLVVTEINPGNRT